MAEHPPQGAVEQQFSKGFDRRFGAEESARRKANLPEIRRKLRETTTEEKPEMTEREHQLFLDAEAFVDQWIQDTLGLETEKLLPSQISLVREETMIDAVSNVTGSVDYFSRMEVLSREKVTTDAAYMHTIIHEIIHAKSRRLNLNSSNAFVSRTGLSLNTRPTTPEGTKKRIPQRRFFNGLNEAITEALSTILMKAYLKQDTATREEYEAWSSEHEADLQSIQDRYGDVGVFGGGLEPDGEHIYITYQKEQLCYQLIQDAMKRAGVTFVDSLFLDASFRQGPEDLKSLKESINATFGKYGWLVLSRWDSLPIKKSITTAELIHFVNTEDPEARDQYALTLLRENKIVGPEWKLGADPTCRFCGFPVTGNAVTCSQCQSRL